MTSEINSDVLLEAVCSNPRKVTMFCDMDHEDDNIPKILLNGKTPEILAANGYKAITVEISKEYQQFIDLYRDGAISREAFIDALPKYKGAAFKETIADVIDKYKPLGISVHGVDSVRFKTYKYLESENYLADLLKEDQGLVNITKAGHYRSILKLNLENASTTKDYWNSLIKDLDEMEAEYKQDPVQFVQKYQLDLDQSNLQSFDELDPEVLKTVFAEKAWHYRVAHDKEVADNIAEVQKITDGKVLNLYGIEHGMDFDDGKTKGYRGKKDLDGYLEDLGLKPNVIGLAGNPDNINAVLKSFNLAEIPNTIIFTGTAAGEDKVNGPCGVYQLTEERSSFRPGTVRSESRPSIRDIVRKEVLSPLGETTLISETPSKLDNVEWKAITPFQLEQLKIKAEIQK